MHVEQDPDASTPVADAPLGEGPALRDARAVAERAARDEADADEARERLRTSPMPVLEPDDRIGPRLEPGELVHALRTSAMLSVPGGDRALGYGGTLYLTSKRLVHLGQVMVGVQLTDVVETSLAGERLLLTLRDGEGLTLDLDRPRLLRAEIAAAMRALR